MQLVPAYADGYLYHTQIRLLHLWGILVWTNCQASYACSPRPWSHLCVWPHLAARRHGARRPEARGLPSTSLPFGLQARHLLDPLPPPPSLNLRTVTHNLRASGSAGMLQYYPTSAHDSHCARPSHVHGSRCHVLSWPLHSCVSGGPCTLSLQMWPLAAARTHPAV